MGLQELPFVPPLPWRITRRVAEVLLLGPCGPLISNVTLGSGSAFIKWFDQRQSKRLLLSDDTLEQIHESMSCGFLRAVVLAMEDWAKSGVRSKLVLVLLLAHSWRRSRQRARRTAYAHALRNPDVPTRRVLLQYKNRPEWCRSLPSWLSTVDTERMDWMNRVFKKLWPYIARTLQGYLDAEKTSIEQMLNKDAPSYFALSLETLTLGTVAPSLKDMQVLQADSQDVRVHTLMTFAGDPQIVVAVTSSKLPFTLRVKLVNLQIAGPLQLQIAPLLRDAPFLGGVSAMFMEPPSLRYDLQVQAASGAPNVSLSYIPGLAPYLNTILMKLLQDMMVFPKALAVPFIESKDGERVLDMLTPAPVGTLQVTVERARNLPNADWSLFGGKSDPYVKLGLGVRGEMPLCCQKTKVIDDNLNPVWDEKFTLDVHSLEVQQLVLEIFDEDTMSADDLLGRVALDLAAVRLGQYAQGAWCTLWSPFAPSESDKRRAALFHHNPPAIFIRIEWVPKMETRSQQPPETLGYEPGLRPFERAPLVASKLALDTDPSGFTHMVRKIISGWNFKEKQGVSVARKFGLPRWLSDSEVNSAHWLNNMEGIVWPVVNKLARDWVAKKNRCGSYNFQASWIDFQLRMDLGQLPMVLVDGIKVASSDPNALILDVSVVVASDMEVGGRFQTLGCPLSDSQVELHHLFVATTLRMHFRPMIAQVPYFTGVVVQAMDDPFVDFKLKLKPCRFLPAVDLASCPGFSVIFNKLMKKALRSTLRYPAGVPFPILDMEDPAVYFHMDLATKVDGVFTVEVDSVVPAPEQGGPFAQLASLGRNRFSNVYAVVTSKTRLDDFEALRHRAYNRKFLHTSPVEMHVKPNSQETSAVWRQHFEFLADEPQETFITIGLFQEAPRSHDNKVLQGKHGSTFKELVDASRVFDDKIGNSRDLFDIPWSVEFHNLFIKASSDIDPLIALREAEEAAVKAAAELAAVTQAAKEVPHITPEQPVSVMGESVVDEVVDVDGEFLTPHSFMTAASGTPSGVSDCSDKPTTTNAVLEPAGVVHRLRAASTKLSSMLTSPAPSETGGDIAGGAENIAEQMDELVDKALSKLHGKTRVEQMFEMEVTQHKSNMLGMGAIQVKAPTGGQKKQIQIPINTGLLQGSSMNVTLGWADFAPFGLSKIVHHGLARGVLIVDVVEARNLDKTATKPNVSLMLAHEEQTGIPSTGRDPVFNQMFVFPGITVAAGSFQTLKVELKNGSTCLGGCRISLRNAVMNGRHTVTQALTPGDCGSIRMTMTWREFEKLDGGTEMPSSVGQDGQGRRSGEDPYL